MGMFEKEEHTLFKPAPTRPSPSDNPAPYRGGGGPSMPGGGDDDEERASIGEILLFAFNSAKRRKVLSLIVGVIGLALTVAAANLAPLSYISAGEVLVVKKDEAGGAWNPDGNKREQLEWEKQILSRSTIENIIKDAKLVDRWDAMRPPHRQLLDSLSQKMGGKAPTDEQKYGALIGMLGGKLRLGIDQTTVTISCEWSDPEAAKDIVQSAITRFIDQRYATEVGSIPARIKVLEEQLESARGELEKLSPSTAPPKEKPTVLTPPSMLVGSQPVGDPELPKKLAAAREKQQQATQKLQEAENAKAQRLAGAQAQLAERASVLGPAHPEIIALKLTVEQAQKDSPDLLAARSAKNQADQEVSDLAAQAGVNIPRPIVRPGAVALPAPDLAGQKKLDDNTQAKVESARRAYDDAKSKLVEANTKLRMEEADFKIKYTISRPPDVPFTPKKPVGMMVGLGGLFATLFMILFAAAIQDRRTGLFFESKQIRDLLRLPVLGDIKGSEFV